MCQYSFAKNLQSQTISEKSCKKHFRMKKLLVKCWKKRHLLSLIEPLVDSRGRVVREGVGVHAT